MIYLKDNWNPFLLFYLGFTAPFILLGIQSWLIDLGKGRYTWFLYLVGIIFLIGVLYEYFGIKKKEVKNGKR